MADVFGKALWNYYRKKDNTPYLLRRDDGHVDKEYPSKYFQTYRQWHAIDRKLIKFAKGRVLDVGAGAGRHSLFFQRKGHKVTAIDISPLVMRVLKLRGVKDVRKVDIRKMNFPKNSFDTVAFMFNNFGLAGNFRDTKKMLKNLERFTTKDAVIIASIGNPYATKLKVHLDYHKLNRSRGRPAGQVGLRLEYKKQKGAPFYLLLISPQELKQLLKGTKWRIHRIFNKNKYYYGAVLKKKR